MHDRESSAERSGGNNHVNYSGTQEKFNLHVKIFEDKNKTKNYFLHT